MSRAVAGAQLVTNLFTLWEPELGWGNLLLFGALLPKPCFIQQANGTHWPKLIARAVRAWLLGCEQEGGMVCACGRVEEKELIPQMLGLSPSFSWGSTHHQVLNRQRHSTLWEATVSLCAPSSPPAVTGVAEMCRAAPQGCGAWPASNTSFTATD